MKTHITDGLQVIVAILITGGMFASAQPLPPQVVPSQNSTVQEVKEPEKPVEAVQAVVEPEKPVEPAPVVEAPVAPKPVAPKPIVGRQSAAPTGTCAEWIAAAGITDVVNANELIRRESGCNPNAVNRSSGACGVAQELPCGKSGCAMGDGACQVKWMNGYVLGRYGSWQAAVNFHNSHNWY